VRGADELGELDALIEEQAQLVRSEHGIRFEDVFPLQVLKQNMLLMMMIIYNFLIPFF
jgi:hypothetical protein